MNSRMESNLLMATVRNGSAASATAVIQPDRQAAISWITLFFAAALVALMSTQAIGQKYEVLELKPAIEEPKFFDKMKSSAKTFIRDASKADPKLAQSYYQRYVPIKITQPDALSEISTLLTETEGLLKKAQRGPEGQKVLVWLYGGLKPIAVGNYSPPARINAILFIAKMSEKPAVRGQVPVPIRYIPSLFLPIYQDDKNSDGVRAAALMGLHRYATIKGTSMKPENITALATAMDALLKSKAPEGRSEEAHAYLQRFAVDILASIRGTADVNFGKTLVSISTKTESHDLIALHSAAQIASMSQGLKGVQPKKILDDWAVRAMRSFQYEIARLNALAGVSPASSQPIDPKSIVTKAEKPKAGSPMAMGMNRDREMDMGRDMDFDMEMGMGGGMDMDMEMGMGMRGGARAKQPPEVMASRRKLNYVLQQLHLGVSGNGVAGVPNKPAGLMAAVDEDGRLEIEAWLLRMEEVLAGLNEPSIGTVDMYIAALDAQVKALEELAGPAAAAAAAKIDIKIDGHAGPVATTMQPKLEMEAVDKNGNPKFPEGLDEMAPAAAKN